MSLYVIRNTFPVLEYPVDGKMRKVPHAEPGDMVHWEHRAAYGKHESALIRDSDGATVFSIGIYKKDQELPVVGVVRQNKSKWWVLILEER